MTDTTSFLLAKLGQVASGRFAERLAPLGLRPRHCAVLELLADAPKAQLVLARTIGVTPSVVVDMIDELERADAVTRVRDPADRRRQIIELTATGRRLRSRALALARDTDEELLGDLTDAQVAALRAGLVTLANSAGLTVARHMS